jgi:uncharacterized protein (TIGR03000 family)
MYTAVLMMAMGTGAEMPACHFLRHRRHRGGDCCGCAGATTDGCTGATTDGGKTDDGKKDDGKTETEKPLTKEEQKVYDDFQKDPDVPAKDKKDLKDNWEKADLKGKRDIIKALKGKDDGSKLETPRKAPATVLVNLPADAKLTIDGSRTGLTSSVRRFVSPAINAGTTYVYTFTATIERDGLKKVETRKVEIRAGKQTRVLFYFPTTRSLARN